MDMDTYTFTDTTHEIHHIDFDLDIDFDIKHWVFGQEQSQADQEPAQGVLLFSSFTISMFFRI